MWFPSRYAPPGRACLRRPGQCGPWRGGCNPGRLPVDGRDRHATALLTSHPHPPPHACLVQTYIGLVLGLTLGAAVIISGVGFAYWYYARHRKRFDYDDLE